MRGMICPYCQNETADAAVSTDRFYEWEGPTEAQQSLHVQLCRCWTCKKLSCESADRHGPCSGFLHDDCLGREADERLVMIQTDRARRSHEWRRTVRKEGTDGE